MKWFPAALALLVLAIFMVIFLRRKSRPKEMVGVLFFGLGLFIYHLGDVGLWAGWNYNATRILASFGLYLEAPCLLYLAYVCLPEDKRNTITKTVSMALCLPWVVAIFMLFGNQAIIYLEGMPGKNEALVNILVLCYVIGFTYAGINALRAVKFNEASQKSLPKTIAISSLAFLLAELVLWSFIDIAGYDATYLFGLLSIFWMGVVGRKTLDFYPEEKPAPSLVH